MAFNPMKFMQAKNVWDGFVKRHPKFPLFLSAVQQHGITADTVIEVEIRTPDGKSFTTNLKVAPEDIEAIRELQDMNR